VRHFYTPQQKAVSISVLFLHARTPALADCGIPLVTCLFDRIDRMDMPESAEPPLTTAYPKRVHPVNPVNPVEKTSYLNYDSIH
jgi:hypothetical protein